MAQTTGIVLAIGGITLVNQTVFNDKPMDWRIPIATGIAALMFTGMEKAWGEGAVMLAWTALIAASITRVQPDVPSPVESALKWWERNSSTKSSTPPSKGSGPATAQV